MVKIINMKILKIISIGLVVVYIGLVVLFESWLGYSQPSNQNSLVITTFDDQVTKDRVLSAVNNDGKLYVSANHHPLTFRILTGFPPRYFIRLDLKD